jgi:hypothetical protein
MRLATRNSARCCIVATAHSVDDECQALPGARLPPPPGLGERANLGLEPSRLLPTCDCVAWTSEAAAARTHQTKPMIITALIMAQFRIKKVDRGEKCAKSCRFRSNVSFMSRTKVWCFHCFHYAPLRRGLFVGLIARTESCGQGWSQRRSHRHLPTRRVTSCAVAAGRNPEGADDLHVHDNTCASPPCSVSQ